ncbi:hypothetical protein OIU85_028781 [Salix viminalis]|uniref:Uncharacterized protein n=1 Tax=Salix viminalis TaxID=40686 RepID=A0A9Q0T6X1_SALVM|nr:hypothetical protein OIU85_028781 [Salix viminalis]
MTSQLSLSSCRLAGRIPCWISTQKALVFLDLKLEEPFPQWLAEMDFFQTTIHCFSCHMLIFSVEFSGLIWLIGRSQNKVSPATTSLSTLSLDLSKNRISGQLAASESLTHMQGKPKSDKEIADGAVLTHSSHTDNFHEEEAK